VATNFNTWNIETQHLPDGQSLYKPLTVKEVQTAIRLLPLRKAPGPDQIPYEFFRAFSHKTISKLTTVLNDTFHAQAAPTRWKRGRVWLIHKKGSIYDIKNYRQITLLNTIYKLYTKIINHRIYKYVEKYLVVQDLQGGFQKYRSCSLKIQTL
jgi:hypothetical protein